MHRFPARAVAWIGLGLLAGVAWWSAVGGSPPGPAPVRGPADVREFGAAGDGAADDADAVQRAVDSGRGDLRFPPGAYRLTRPVMIDLDKTGPVSITGEGGARIVMAGPGPALRITGTHQGTASPATVKPEVWLRQRMPTVADLEIVGDHEEACGIEAAGTIMLTVSRVSVRKALHGVHLVRRNRNVIVADCHLYENRGAGLYLDDVDLHQINVSGCHISYNAGGGVVCHAGCVRNLQISGCDIEANTVNVLLDSAGGVCGTAEVAITGCTIQHGGGPNSANVRVLGSDKDRSWGHVTIAANVLSDVETNVDLRGASDVAITGNTFWSGHRYNLRAEECERLVVGSNVFGRNPAYRDDATSDNAILFRACRDLTLSGLLVHRVRRAEAGLVLEDCRRVNLTGSTVVDCDGGGILLKNATLARVSDCLVQCDGTEESWPAVRLTGGRDNLITGNLVGGKIEVDPQSGQAVNNKTLAPREAGQSDACQPLDRRRRAG